MDRRTFFTASAGLALIPACGAQERDEHPGAASPEKPVTELAGMSLGELRERYRSDLFDVFLPFMERHVIDHEFGGFMCNTRPDGTNVATEKRAVYEGRGIWVYSYLYNNIAREQKYLDVAERSVRLLLRNKPRGAVMWPSAFTKEGEPSRPPSSSVNADLYIADGLQEFAKATGDDTWWDEAKDILIKCLSVYDRADYGPNAGRMYLGKNAPPTPGIRIMDDWMLFLWTATQMLKQRSDMDLLMIVTQCLDTIMNRFYNPATGLVHEILNHDYTRPRNDYAQIVSFGNDFQALWHVMAAAERIDNHDQFDTAAERLRRHIEVAWDDVYDGVLNLLVHVDDNVWRLAKAHYVQVEPLVGLLMVIEQTGDEWAREWFGRIYAYERGKFHLNGYGYPIWMNSADRKAIFRFEKCTRIGNFHQPRHLMLNLTRLDRLIERGGRPARLSG